MPEDSEIETQELQETIHEMHEREEEEKRSNWIKYVGLSTAILAVIAAIAALQSGSLVNEALINQVKASDTWNEYQASREKSHLYTITVDSLLDQPSPGNASPLASAKPPKGFQRKGPAGRIVEFASEVKKEDKKAGVLSKEARDLERKSGKQLHSHHFFAYSVALIQVAIALGAVSALARVKWVWFVSMACGLIGIGAFLWGFLR